jgi:hypothetical protein
VESSRNLENQDSHYELTVWVISVVQNQAKPRLGAVLQLPLEVRVCFEDLGNFLKDPRKLPVAIENKQRNFGIAPTCVSE